MVFLIWMAAWIAKASTWQMLVASSLVIIVRTLYLDRPIRRVVKLFPILAGMGFFVVNTWTGHMSDSQALVEGLKLPVSGWLAMHLAIGARNLRIPRMHPSVMAFYYFLQTSVGLVTTRLSDVGYSARSRWRHPDATIKTRARLMARAIITGGGELLGMVAPAEKAIAARGGWPDTLAWTVPQGRRVSTVLGDVAFLLLVLLPAVFAVSQLIPEIFANAIKALSGAF